MNMLDSEQITKLRTALGMTQTQLAAELGVTENAVRRWEYGDRHPRWETMQRLNDLAAQVAKGATGPTNGHGKNGHKRRVPA